MPVKVMAWWYYVDNLPTINASCPAVAKQGQAVAGGQHAHSASSHWLSDTDGNTVHTATATVSMHLPD